MGCLALLITACSTEKNTARSRWWQSFNTRYNVYYNGSVAYIDGALEKENGNKDNFTELIPLYTVANKGSRELGKGNFEKAIEKSQKAIKLHSIKRRPEWTKNRRKTDKDLEWLGRKEYNPFMWKVWMLMGRAQFHSGDFDGAASTFSYMSRLFQTQPAIYGKARAWLAKAYVENGWMYDAEDVIRNMQRDSIHWRAQKEWDYTYADYYIHTKEYEKAIPYLKKVISHEMRRKQKARECYLLGQLEAALGHHEEAYKAFARVIKLNPPYELEFNARIAQTEVMASRQARQMVGKLRRMAASENNKDYLDQVYYAMGNIYLAQRDTAQAISSYEKGVAKATRSGIEKGVLLLRLGDLYWQLEKYSDARRCYGEAIGLLDKERPDYEQLSDRSKVLDELVPYTDAVHLQDSLQTLARASEAERNAAIDRVIEALKKKEKEERDRQAEAQAQEVMQKNGAQGNITATPTVTTTQQSGSWYFYNPMAVQQGKQQFQRIWGKRANVDDWQRVNKTVVAGMGNLADNGDTQVPTDSLSAAGQASAEKSVASDSLSADPHRREYYLAQIPFTDEQMRASNEIIMDGLHHCGVIFKDKLDNLPLSEKALRRVTDHYPDYAHIDEVYYHLFLLYSRLGRNAQAEEYVARLSQQFPNSHWTTLLTDPYFVQNAKYGVHIEDSLYAATYDAFKADRFAEVSANSNLSETRFPLGANRDKFLFIGGLAKLNAGEGEACVTDMKALVQQFPQSQLAEMAGMIVNGVNAGRRLRGGKFDLGSVWSRRTVVLNDSDAIQARKLSNERNTNFVFMLVYHPDSVNQNKLLFELARYNFTSYLVRDFDIHIDDADGLHRMQVGGFRSYDEALLYARQLLKQTGIMALASKARPVIISEENLPLLGTNYSYDEYDKFYADHFAPLKVSTFYLLSEPAELPTTPEPQTEAAPTPTDIDNFLEGTVLVPEEPVQPAGTIVIPVEEPQPAAASGTTVIPDEAPAVPAGTTVIPVDVPVQPATPAQPVASAQPKPTKPSQPTPAKSATTGKAPVTDPRKTVKKPAVAPTGKPATPTTAKPTPKAVTPPTVDLEDEYYDLEGF
jgi:tetratricopeptide (TPR) repeat protein